MHWKSPTDYRYNLDIRLSFLLRAWVGSSLSGPVTYTIFSQYLKSWGRSVLTVTFHLGLHFCSILFSVWVSGIFSLLLFSVNSNKAKHPSLIFFCKTLVLTRLYCHTLLYISGLYNHTTKHPLMYSAKQLDCPSALSFSFSLSHLRVFMSPPLTSPCPYTHRIILFYVFSAFFE